MGLASRTLRAVTGRTWDPELAGLDALEAEAGRPARHGLRRIVAAAWPKLAALGIALAAWQLVVLSGWKPEYALPGPVAVFEELGRQLADGKLLTALGITARRAAAGYGIALLVGAAIGIAVSRWSLLRAAVGSLITGLQTMPSIAWFPLAILLFGLNETAILFVVVLGAAPAIANGLISGIDHVPPLLLRAGRVLGARGISAYRHVILPAALPSAVAGLKQGWAFAWRSLMAGELLVIVVGQTGIGARLQYARELSDAPGLMATMIAILVLGILVDIVLFGLAERSIRERRGLIEATA
jgi:NitT/TauT family transport system permease protein